MVLKVDEYGSGTPPVWWGHFSSRPARTLVEIMVLPNASCSLFVCFVVPWFSWFLFLSVAPLVPPSSPTQTTLHFLIRCYCGSYTVVAMFFFFFLLSWRSERSDGAVLALNKVMSHDDEIFSFYGRMFFWTQYYVKMNWTPSFSVFRFDHSYMGSKSTFGYCAGKRGHRWSDRLNSKKWKCFHILLHCCKGCKMILSSI